MGIVRNPANTMRRGRVGETTYYISGGQQIARQALNGSNFGESARRSEAQQRRRVLWANLVNFYKASRFWMPKAFETKKRNQSDYNKFMQLNINTSKIALTKTESESGACVAAAYIVSQGSLPSIRVSEGNQQWTTNIGVGALSIDDETTVGEFSRAVIANNGHIVEGMQLSFVSYQQSVDVLNIPRLISRLYEVTLNSESSELLRDYLPDFCSDVVDGFLSTNTMISTGGFAYILSQQTSTGLQVSTQQLTVNNASLLAVYTSTAQRDKAVDSYGLDTEVVLSPVTLNSQTAEDQPNYIEYVEIDGVKYYPGSYLGTLASLSGKTVTVTTANPFKQPAENVYIGTSKDDWFTMQDVYEYTNVKLRAKVATSTSDKIVSYIQILDDDNKLISITFDNSPIGGDL